MNVFENSPKIHFSPKKHKGVFILTTSLHISIIQK